MDLRKIDIYYIVTLLFVLVTANASFLSSSDIWWFASMIFMFLLAVEKKMLSSKDLKVLGTFSLVYLVYVAIRDLLIGSLDSAYLISDIVFLFKLIFLSYIFCVILKEKAAAYLVKVITHLTVVSLFFYFFQLIGLGSVIYTFSSGLHLPSGNSIPGYTNFLFFTLVQGFHDYRNSGFSWEPGAFGGFLIIALSLNFFLNKFTFDKKSIILIIGVLTTVATTDYLALLIVLFMAYRYRAPKVNLWTILLIVIFVSLVWYIPFLGNKIKDTYYEDLADLNRLKFLDIYYRHNKMQIPLNRVSSMVIIYQTFGEKLILGVSNKYDVLLNTLNKANINISNGIFEFLAKFGLVGFTYLLYRYARFCYAQVKRVEPVFYCIGILLVVGFGEPLLVLPIVLMFMFIQAKQVDFKKIKRGLPGEEDETDELAYPASRKKLQIK